MLRVKGVLPLIWLSVAISICRAAEKTPIFGPPPSWVQRVDAPAPVESPTNQVNAGVALVLFDSQVNADTQESFLRIVKDLLSSGGVQEGSRLSFSFDPSYQDLTIHQVSIIRGSNVLDHLAPEKFRLIQRERDLERHLYDGTLTAVLFLEDVRVGDRIEYSFTVRGRNPILEGRYVGGFQEQWSIPVQRNRMRLLWPSNRKLGIKSHGATCQPQITETNGIREYVWDLDEVQPRESEDSLPLWYDAYGSWQFSEFASWDEVSRWALRLYPAKSPLPPQLKQKIQELQEQHNTDEDRVAAAVQFVQDEVRYLGFEFGPGSHRPSLPGEVFARRFGDCKDKSFLLCAMLEELGFRSWPVLVNTIYRGHVSNWLPSPYAFNHVIVQVEIPRGILTVDPTRTNQRGPVASRFVPNYALGLPLRENTYALTRIRSSGGGAPLISTHEIFEVKGRQEPARLTVHTKWYGAEADRMRGTLLSSTKEELQRSFLNYYAERYPGITNRAPIQIQDHEAINLVEVSEQYEIIGFWKPAKDPNNHTCTFYAQSISSQILRPTIKLRQMPLGWIHPHREKVRTEIHLPQVWTVNPETSAIQSPAFKFNSHSSYSNRQIVLEYDYEALSDFVATDQVPAHLKALDEVEESLSYTLTWRDQQGDWSLQNVNWAVLGMAAVYSCLLLVGAFFLLRYDPVPLQSPMAENDTPGRSGLGGWLILIGIGLVVTPLKVLNLIVQSYPAYALPQWQEVTVPGGSSYHALYGLLLVFELLGNLTQLFYSVVLLILFFGKRTSFPRLFIIWLGFDLAFTLSDELLSEAVPSVGASMKTSQWFVMLLRCCIWITYMLRSRRVRGTFITRRQLPAMRPPPVPSIPALTPGEPGADQETRDETVPV